MASTVHRTFQCTNLHVVLLIVQLFLHYSTQHNAHDMMHHHDEPQPNGDNCAQNLDQNDTVTVDLRLKKVKVPNVDTTYMCQTFDLPTTLDRDLHMIAVLPLIDAKVVVHHIILFGCDPRQPPIEYTDTPQVCGIMPLMSCRSLIGTWTMGSSGDCAHPEMGFRVGPRGYKQVFMQVHFNNPGLLGGLMDSSGLRLYFTESLRNNDAGMLVVGQRSLQIDPLNYQDGSQSSFPIKDDQSTRYVSESVSFTAECPGHCTQHMFGEKGVFITSAVNHMHSLGVSQRIQVYRNNSLIHTITDQQEYNYNHPVIYRFDKPIHVLPGDEIRTTCVYKRPKSQHPVCFGEATSDEMCFGFITYYPTQPLRYPWCTSMDSMKSCDRHLPQLGLRPINGCKWWEFRNISLPETKMMFGGVLMSCYSKGTLQCSEECNTIVNRIITHPCMQGDVGVYMIDRIKKSGKSAEMFMDALLTCSCRHFRYCDRKLPKGFLGQQQQQFCPDNTASSTSAHWSRVLLVFLLVKFYHFTRQ